MLTYPVSGDRRDGLYARNAERQTKRNIIAMRMYLSLDTLEGEGTVVKP